MTITGWDSLDGVVVGRVGLEPTITSAPRPVSLIGTRASDQA